MVIINETLARKYFEGRNLIGERIDIGTYRGDEVIPGFDDPERAIAGVVADVRAQGLDQEVTEAMYIPRAQAGHTRAGFTRCARPEPPPTPTSWRSSTCEA